MKTGSRSECLEDRAHLVVGDAQHILHDEIGLADQLHVAIFNAVVHLQWIAHRRREGNRLASSHNGMREGGGWTIDMYLN